MDPTRRLAFFVLLRRVKDLRAGLPMAADERSTIEAWAQLSGIRPASVYALCQRAAAGEVDPIKVDPGATPQRIMVERYGIATPRAKVGRRGRFDFEW